MGVKTLIFLVAVMVLISGCVTEEKTKPVVTDISGEVKETVSEEEKVIEKNETILEEVEEMAEEEINESEEEEQEELPPGTHIVTIKDLKLDPQELTIKKGDTVIWEHEDTWEEDEETKHYLATHTNEFRSPILYYGDTFEYTFDKTGTFTYIDIIYKERDYMRGKIVVE